MNTLVLQKRCRLNTNASLEKKLNERRNLYQNALKENEICTFDPVCKTNQNGACIACTFIPEVCCAHFNKDLSRSYLYGGVIKLGEEEIKVMKGFWK